MAMKNLTPLEKEQIFGQVINYDSLKISFADHWQKWILTADEKINPDYQTSMRSYRDMEGKIRGYLTPLIKFFINEEGTWRYTDSLNGKGFFTAFKAVTGYEEHHAIDEFLGLFKIDRSKKKDNLFGIYSEEELPVLCDRYEYDFPMELKVGDEIFIAKKQYEIFERNGLIKGAYIKYELNNEFFYLYGKIQKTSVPNHHSVVLGRPNGKIPLFNEDKIIMNGHKVVFSMSIEKALKTECATVTIANTAYTFTTCLDCGCEVSEIDFSSLRAKDIYFIPKGNDESIKKCLEYIDQLEMDSSYITKTEKTIVKSIRISKSFIASYNEEKLKELMLSNDPFERFMAESSSSGEFELDLNDTYTVDEFKDKLREVGLLPPADDKGEKLRSVSVAFDSQESTYSENSLEHYLRRSMLTGIIGESNAGKTLLGYTMAACLAAGIDFLDFKVERSHKVLYFDAETAGQDVQARRKRIFDGYDISEKKFGKALHVFPLHGNSEIDIPEVELMNDDFQNWIQNSIKENNAEYVFFDNLASLGNNIDSHHNWPKVKNIFREIEKIGCSVIYFHHLKKSGDISGSEKIENLSQNVIALRGRKTISADYPELKLGSLPSADCVFELEYRKSKGNIHREKLKQVWRLKADPIDMEKDGKWIRLDLPQNDTKESGHPEVQNQAKAIFCERLGREPVLQGGKKESLWKQDVLLLYAIERHLVVSEIEESWFRLADVERLFETTNQDKRNQLTVLVESGLLDMSNAQKAKRWRYRPEQLPVIDHK